MQDGFLEAFVHASRHIVLGRKLHPLCLHDVLKLQLLNSPFAALSANQNITLLDLQLAAIVCSTPFERFTEATNLIAPSFWNKLRFWVWTWLYSHVSLESEVQKFLTYIEDYYSVPETWNDKHEQGGSGIPWPLSIATLLTRKSNLSWAEIWTKPIGEMMWLFIAIAEQEGSGLEIATEDELEALRIVKQKVDSPA